MPTILLPPPSPGLQTGEGIGRVLPLTPITGWLRISGIRRVRICGTHTPEIDALEKECGGSDGHKMAAD